MSKNEFADLLAKTALDDASAAGFIGVRQRAIKRWRLGMGPARESATSKLKDLHSTQFRYANEIIIAWKADGARRGLTLIATSTDEQAAEKGWPSLLAEETVARLVEAMAPEIKVRLERNKCGTATPSKQQAFFNIFDDYDR